METYAKIIGFGAGVMAFAALLGAAVPWGWLALLAALPPLAALAVRGLWRLALAGLWRLAGGPRREAASRRLADFERLHGLGR